MKSLSDHNADLVDLLEPRERLLYEALERQMQLTNAIMRSLNATRWWAVVCGLALATSITIDALVHWARP
jgi:hypothetical protein